MSTSLLVVKDGTLKLGPVATQLSVECQISRMEIVAAPDPKEFTSVCGKTTVPGVTGWTLNLEGAQDWSTDGISTFLFEQDGTLVDFELVPSAALQPTATGKVWVSPGSFGGVAGEISTFSVSLGLDGKPTITPATVVAAAGVQADEDDVDDELELESVG